jgi:SAM-dependent methyltransferase
MKCRLCEGETILLKDRGDVSLHRCPGCGFVSGRPLHDETPAERYHDYYAGPDPPTPGLRYDEWLRYAEAQGAKGRLLEVGAGSGGFVRVAMERGWQAHATEVSQTAAAALRATGSEVFLGEVEDAHYPDGAFDLVVALEVLEHLDRPLDHLREWARVLRPGGLLLITTPNLRGLTGRLLGIRWRVVDPEHLGYFTRRTLGAALQSAGYSGARIQSRSIDVFAWRRAPAGHRAAAFEPVGAAHMRDRVNSHLMSRGAKEAVHAALGIVGLGDTLLAWATK